MTEQPFTDTAILVGGPLAGMEALIRPGQTDYTPKPIYQYPPSAMKPVSYTSTGTADNQGRVVFNFDESPE